MLIFECAERIHTPTRTVGSLRTRTDWRILSRREIVENGLHALKFCFRSDFLIYSTKQFAVNIVRSCRQNGTKTPFLRHVLTEEDAFLGRPLTDSELAEDCMGGMCVTLSLNSAMEYVG